MVEVHSSITYPSSGCANKVMAARTMPRIAIAKGRIFTQVIQLLAMPASDAYTAFIQEFIPVYSEPSGAGPELVKVRGRDLPWLLRDGHVDFAIGSSIWFDELGFDGLFLREKLPLKPCRLSVIAAKNLALGGIRRICTKFPNLARQYIGQHNPAVEIIQMEGCHEVALSLHLADAIIDIIETGQTIQRMNFVEIDRIMDVTQGIWVRQDYRQPFPGFVNV